MDSIISGLVMSICAVAFVISWARLKGSFKNGYEWAILFVPLSLFFDVINERSNRWRYINLLSSLLLPVVIAWFLYTLFASS